MSVGMGHARSLASRLQVFSIVGDEYAGIPNLVKL